MKSIVAITAVCLFLCGCELIVLSSKSRVPLVELSQKSPVGTIFLFKAELDSSNLKGATELMLQPSGKPFLAIQKYELYDDLKRLKRIIGDKPVTSFKSDSLSPVSTMVNLEFDYLKTISFTTQRINELWFIIGYNE